jgi:ubiquinone biosynthesis protein
MFFQKTIGNIGRMRKIIEVLLKYGFEDFVWNSSLNRLFPSRRRKKSSAEGPELRFNRWERLRLVIEELGPTFIKLAQMLSNRPDLLPASLIVEFEKLQDEVPPFDVALARSIIERETGKKIGELFLYFDEKPLGSASIGQVHRARLLTGEDVVVKVQRPEARRMVMSDLSLLREFVRLTEGYFRKAGILNPLEVVDAFSKSLVNELDYTSEARHLDQFRKLFRKQKRLYVPRPYRELTTRKIITIEFISGSKVTDLETLRSWGLDPKVIARNGLDIYLSQIFDYGIFHADPHPGNVLVRPNGSIALIDFGMVGKLMQSQRFAFAGVFISLARRDAKSMAVNLRRLSIDHEIDDMHAFEYDLNELIQDYTVLDADDMTLRDLTGRIQKIAYKYKLQIPGVIFLILRSLTILEGVARVLDPNFDVQESIRPYGLRLLRQQYSFNNLSKELRYSFNQLYSLFYNIPLELRDIVKQVRKGKITLNMRVSGFDRMIRQVDLAASRMMLGVVAGAMAIAAAISYGSPASAGAAQLFGLPYLTLFFLALAAALGVLLLLNDLSGRRNRNNNQ